MRLCTVLLALLLGATGCDSSCPPEPTLDRDVLLVTLHGDGDALVLTSESRFTCRRMEVEVRARTGRLEVAVLGLVRTGPPPCDMLRIAPQPVSVLVPLVFDARPVDIAIRHRGAIDRYEVQAEGATLRAVETRVTRPAP